MTHCVPVLRYHAYRFAICVIGRLASKAETKMSIMEPGSVQ